MHNIAQSVLYTTPQQEGKQEKKHGRASLIHIKQSVQEMQQAKTFSELLDKDFHLVVSWPAFKC